jgi:hypothetical protein
MAKLPFNAKYSKREWSELQSPKGLPILAATYWVVEKQEEWTGKTCVYRLLLRCFPLVATRNSDWQIDGVALKSGEYDPKLGVLLMPVIKKTFDMTQVGQMVRMTLALGAQMAPAVTEEHVLPRKRRKKGQKAQPVRGARKLFGSKQKMGFELQ